MKDIAGWKRVRRREHSKTGRSRLYVDQHPGDAQLSQDELRDMVGWEGDAFSNRVLAILHSTITYLLDYIPSDTPSHSVMFC